MNEPIRIFADWLKDPTHGVATMLGLVPRDAGDPLPGAGAVSVFDETRDADAAAEHFPDPGSGIVVTVTLAFSRVSDNAAAQRSGHHALSLLVRVGLRSANMANAKRDGNYVLRAVLWSLRRFGQQDPNSHIRNGFRLALHGDAQLVEWWETIEDTLITAAITIPFDTTHDFGLP